MDSDPEEPECGTCLTDLRLTSGNIMQCPSGHMQCSECFVRLGGSGGACPACFQRLGAIRNLYVEKMRDAHKARQQAAITVQTLSLQEQVLQLARLQQNHWAAGDSRETGVSSLSQGGDAQYDLAGAQREKEETSPKTSPSERRAEARVEQKARAGTIADAEVVQRRVANVHKKEAEAVVGPSTNPSAADADKRVCVDMGHGKGRVDYVADLKNLEHVPLAGGFQKGELVRALIAHAPMNVKVGDEGTVVGPSNNPSAADADKRVCVDMGPGKGRVNYLASSNTEQRQEAHNDDRRRQEQEDRRRHAGAVEEQSARTAAAATAEHYRVANVQRKKAQEQEGARRRKERRQRKEAEASEKQRQGDASWRQQQVERRQEQRPSRSSSMAPTAGALGSKPNAKTSGLLFPAGVTLLVLTFLPFVYIIPYYINMILQVPAGPAARPTHTHTMHPTARA